MQLLAQNTGNTIGDTYTFVVTENKFANEITLLRHTFLNCFSSKVPKMPFLTSLSPIFPKKCDAREQFYLGVYFQRQKFIKKSSHPVCDLISIKKKSNCNNDEERITKLETFSCPMLSRRERDSRSNAINMIPQTIFRALQ